MTEKISVIMSVYKEPEEQLRSSIESILKQTYSNFEFIIILDNPDEKWRKDFINSYHDNRIRFFVNKKNVGLTKSLNKALTYATGDYIARMDADDISMPNRLEKQMDFLAKNGYDMCGSFLEFFDDKNFIEKVILPEDFKLIKKNLKYYNCVYHPTWLAKRVVYEKNNGYVDIYTCEDYDFLIRAILNNFRIGNVPEILLRYRLSEDGISRKNAIKQRVIAEYISKNYRNGKNASFKEFKKYYDSDKYKIIFSRYCRFQEYNIKRKESKNIIKKMFYLFLMFTKFNVWPRRVIEEIYKKRV